MKIEISIEYDGFAVIVNGERFWINQEDDHFLLADIFKAACPDAEITIEESY